MRADGVTSAWGLSFWTVTDENLREVSIDDIGGAGRHVLYFNEQLSGFVCSHSGQRGFDPYKFSSPDDAGAPKTWSKPKVNAESDASLLASLMSSISIGGPGTETDFGSTTIDFDGLLTIRGLTVHQGPIAYAKGSEILQLDYKAGPAPCRQVLESKWPHFYHLASDVAECFLGHNVLSVSYAWAVRGGGHPDPDGFHLKRLQLILKNYMEIDGRDPAVFLDWFSLYQLHCAELPRTDEQTKMFDVGLRLMHVNYGHKGARVVLLTDLPRTPDLKGYYERGWPLFERSCAACGANWVVPFSLSESEVALARRPGAPRRNYLVEFRMRRAPPVLPEEFDAQLAGASMTEEADRALVRRLYKECFETIAGATRKLALCNIGADDAWVRRLCAALPRYARLECLDLSGAGNAVTNAGARELSRVLPRLPRLRVLYLLDVRLSPQCEAELRAACAGRELALGPSG